MTKIIGRSLLILAYTPFALAFIVAAVIDSPHHLIGLGLETLIAIWIWRRFSR